MEKTKNFFNPMRFLLLILLFFAAGCSNQETKMPPPASVTAFKVEPQTIPALFEFVGVTKSSHPVEIRARVEGYLLSINYTEGSVVNPNELLFRLDPSQFEASLNEAKGVLARQEAVLWRAKKNLDRMQPLYEKNAVSERDLDNAIAQVLAAEAEVISAKAKVELAELNLSYTYITAPVKGWTGRAFFREGSLITPSVNGLLTYVSVINPIWVYFSVTESQLLARNQERNAEELIFPPQQDYVVTLQLANGSIFPYKGKVNFSSPIFDPDTGTIMVRAEFPNPENELLPGEFVRATVSGAYYPNALFVPQQSVVQGKKGPFVFVVEENGKASSRDVELGSWYKDYWIIRKGINPGEVVVADGVNKIQNGSSVHVTGYLKAPIEEQNGKPSSEEAKKNKKSS